MSPARGNARWCFVVSLAGLMTSRVISCLEDIWYIIYIYVHIYIYICLGRWTRKHDLGEPHFTKKMTCPIQICWLQTMEISRDLGVFCWMVRWSTSQEWWGEKDCVCLCRKIRYPTESSGLSSLFLVPFEQTNYPLVLQRSAQRKISVVI